MKRRRTSTAKTGWEYTGTGDVRPQFFSTTVTQSAADTTTTQSVSSPPGIGIALTGRNEALAMEILKVYFDFDAIDTTFANSAGANGSFDFRRAVYLSNKNFGTTEPALRSGDATVFAWYQLHSFQFENTVASLSWVDKEGYCLDLTDSAGHGLLYANQNIYIQLVSSTTGHANVCRIKILYREVKINEAELLGLVLQSNQN